MLKENAKRWLIEEVIEATDHIMTLKDKEGGQLISELFSSFGLRTDMVLFDLPTDDLVNLVFGFLDLRESICLELGIPIDSLVISDAESLPTKH